MNLKLKSFITPILAFKKKLFKKLLGFLYLRIWVFCPSFPPLSQHKSLSPLAVDFNAIIRFANLQKQTKHIVKIWELFSNKQKALPDQTGGKIWKRFPASKKGPFSRFCEKECAQESEHCQQVSHTSQHPNDFLWFRALQISIRSFPHISREHDHVILVFVRAHLDSFAHNALYLSLFSTGSHDSIRLRWCWTESRDSRYWFTRSRDYR